MKFQIFQKPLVAVLLSILVPGLGHALWGEYLFSVFVFFIMLTAMILFYLSFLVQVPALLYWVLLGMPLLFYLFSLIDLARVIRLGKAKRMPSVRRAVYFLVVALSFQVLVPGSPLSFAWHNHPSVFRVVSGDFSPVLTRGELALIRSSSYYVNLFFFDRAIYHTLPARYDLIRYRSEGDYERTGVVIGLPEEQIEAANGVIVANGVPQFEPRNSLVLQGDCPLTSNGSYSILVADLYFGSIATVREVSLFEVIGKVSPLP